MWGRPEKKSSHSVSVFLLHDGAKRPNVVSSWSRQTTFITERVIGHKGYWVRVSGLGTDTNIDIKLLKMSTFLSLLLSTRNKEKSFHFSGFFGRIVG